MIRRTTTPYAVTPSPSSRQAGKISSSMPREISEYSICGHDRMHRRCTTNGRNADFGQPALHAHSALIISPIAPTVSNRHVGIEPRQAVDIDVIGFQTLPSEYESFLTAAGRAYSVETTSRQRDRASPDFTLTIAASRREAGALSAPRRSTFRYGPGREITGIGCEVTPASSAAWIVAMLSARSHGWTIHARHAHTAQTDGRAARGRYHQLKFTAVVFLDKFRPRDGRLDSGIGRILACDNPLPIRVACAENRTMRELRSLTRRKPSS